MIEETRPKLEKRENPRIKNLELNKVTAKELAEQESEHAEGGRAAQASAACDSCTNILSGY